MMSESMNGIKFLALSLPEPISFHEMKSGPILKPPSRLKTSNESVWKTFQVGSKARRTNPIIGRKRNACKSL